VIRFRHRDDAAAPAGDGGTAVTDAADEHRSPGLSAALAIPATRAGCRILDLGPAVPSNLSFVSSFAAHLRIADLAAEVGRPGGPEGDEPTGWSEALEALDGRFDLVLAWDLFSRVEGSRCLDLVEQLRKVTRPGGALFLLIHEGPEMPAEPSVFEIRDRDRIAYRSKSSSSVRAPKIPPAEVARRLSGFRIDASFVLRHGIREYVAVRETCDEAHIS